MKKIMLIGIGWEQIPLLEKAKKMGLKTIVTTMWNKEKLDADTIYQVDSRDLSMLEEIFLAERPDAVLSDECDYSMYAVAYLTEKYNLPGPSLYSLTVTNNKFLQRELIAETTIEQPKYRLCWNIEMALLASRDIGFPVVIKPLDNRGSIGVFTAKNSKELEVYWYLSVANSHSRMCIVEECVEGNVITFEAFYDSEKLNFLSIATKDNYPETKNVAKALYYPGKVSSSLLKKITDAGEKIVSSMRINYGFVHIEFMIDNINDRVYFIEAANRGGGVHISNIILPEITGIDLVKNNIEMALGIDVRILWNKEYNNKVVMYFLNPKGDCKSEVIIKNNEENLLAMYLRESASCADVSKNGALGRLGMVIVRGDEFENIIEDCLQLEHKISTNLEEHFWKEMGNDR